MSKKHKRKVKLQKQHKMGGLEEYVKDHAIKSQATLNSTAP